MEETTDINWGSGKTKKPPDESVVYDDAIFRFITSGHKKLGLSVNKERRREITTNKYKELSWGDLNLVSV